MVIPEAKAEMNARLNWNVSTCHIQHEALITLETWMTLLFTLPPSLRASSCGLMPGIVNQNNIADTEDEYKDKRERRVVANRHENMNTWKNAE